MEAARRLTAPPRQKRFYKIVEMRREEGRFALRLDGKRAMTPGRKPLAVPQRAPRRCHRGRVASAGGAHRPCLDAGHAPRQQRHRRRGGTAGGGTARGSRLCGRRSALLPRRGSRRGWCGARTRSGIRSSPGPRPASVCRSNWRRASCMSRSPVRRMRRLAVEIDRYDEPFRLAGLSLATTLDRLGTDRAGGCGRHDRCGRRLGGRACRRGLEHQPVGRGCRGRPPPRPPPRRFRCSSSGVEDALARSLLCCCHPGLSRSGKTGTYEHRSQEKGSGPPGNSKRFCS